MNYINYDMICDILRVDRNKPTYNPKNFETILKHIEQVNAIIQDKEKAEEIINLAQIGCFWMLQMEYQ